VSASLESELESESESVSSVSALSDLLVYKYTTFLGLRRECHIQSLLEILHNLDQFLSKSDALWLVSDQLKVQNSLQCQKQWSNIDKNSGHTQILIQAFYKAYITQGTFIKVPSTPSDITCFSIVTTRVYIASDFDEFECRNKQEEMPCGPCHSPEARNSQMKADMNNKQ
jgi:hypothetical protein